MKTANFKIDKIDFNVIKKETPEIWDLFETFLNDFIPYYKYRFSIAQHKSMYYIFLGGLMSADAINNGIRSLRKQLKKEAREEWKEEVVTAINYIDKVVHNVSDKKEPEIKTGQGTKSKWQELLEKAQAEMKAYTDKEP